MSAAEEESFEKVLQQQLDALRCKLLESHNREAQSSQLRRKVSPGGGSGTRLPKPTFEDALNDASGRIQRPQDQPHRQHSREPLLPQLPEVPELLQQLQDEARAEEQREREQREQEQMQHQPSMGANSESAGAGTPGGPRWNSSQSSSRHQVPQRGANKIVSLGESIVSLGEDGTEAFLHNTTGHTSASPSMTRGPSTGDAEHEGFPSEDIFRRGQSPGAGPFERSISPGASSVSRMLYRAFHGGRREDAYGSTGGHSVTSAAGRPQLPRSPTVPRITVRPTTSNGRKDYVPRNAWLRRGVTAAVAKPPSYNNHKRKRRAPMNASLTTDLGFGGWVVLPGSDIRLAWAVLTAIVLSCDLLTLPVRACFALDAVLTYQVLDMVSLAFWLSDIILSFFTAVLVRNTLIATPRRMAWHYMGSHFFSDLTIWLADLLLLLAQMSLFAELSDEQWVAIRWVRFIRLARIVKVVRILLRPLLDHFVFEGNFRTMVMHAAMFIFGINLFACCWHAVGRIDDDGWATQGDNEGWSVWQKYAYALHLSAARLQGTSSTQPSTTSESLMAMLNDLACFVASALFLSHLVRAVAARRSKTQAERMRRITISFVQSHGVPPYLQRSLKQWLKSYRAHQGISEQQQDNKLLMSQLPENLLYDLLHEVRGTIVRNLKLFRELETISMQVFRKLCHLAISELGAMEAEVVFDPNTTCTQMVFVQSGRLTYHLDDDDELSVYGSNNAGTRGGTMMISPQLAASKRNQTAQSQFFSGVLVEENLGFCGSKVVCKGESLAEPILWTTWAYAGKLQAIGESALLGLNADYFAQALEDEEEAKVHASLYCRLFVKRLNAACAEQNVERSDIMVFYDSFDDLYAHPDGSDDHFIFLSHFKEEAGTEATLILENLERMIASDLPHIANDLNTPVFLDSENLRDLNLLKEHVKRSHNLVLLLTPGVLSRPWCLYEIVLAFQAGTQIIPVQVQRPGTQFKLPEEAFFERVLRGDELTREAELLLDGEGVSLIEVHEALRHTFSQIVIHFSPHSTAAIRHAELAGVLKRCVYMGDDTDIGIRSCGYTEHRNSGVHHNQSHQTSPRAHHDPTPGDTFP